MRLWRRTSTWIGLAGALLSLSALEVGYRAYRGPGACVEVVNRGPVALRGVRVSADGRPSGVSSIPPGRSALLLVNAYDPAPLALEFREGEGAPASYRLQGFDPELLRLDGRKLVVEVQGTRLTRYSEADDRALGPLRRLGRDLRSAAYRLFLGPP